MFANLIDRAAARISNMILQGAKSAMTETEFFEREISRWKYSPKRIMQIKGHLYYDNEHDILYRKRTVIGKDGKLVEVKNLPNNRIIDNQYAKLVNQKVNYLLGQPFVVEGKNDRYVDELKQIFNRRFMKQIKTAGRAMLNGGIAWLYPCYDDNGEFGFRLFPGYEILPFWKDSEHTVLDTAVRLYRVEAYEGTVRTIIEKVEIYDLSGVHRFILDGGTLIPDVNSEDKPPTNAPYITTIDETGSVIGLNWSKVPLIALKYNETETPLIKRVKSLQDGINVMLSDFENNMQEDARNTILVIKNYDGTDLGEFRKNLTTYGAVKVRSEGGAGGGVETLEVNVNAENYKAIVDIFKKAMIENGMGYDAKDERMSGTPNQMNIQSMYSDIDLDANEMETELQAAFEEILWFVNAHLVNTGRGNFENEDVNIIFNRDMMMDEGNIIDNICKSIDILSSKTLIAQHPWVDDIDEELRRIEEEKQNTQDKMYNPFLPQGKVTDDEE